MERLHNPRRITCVLPKGKAVPLIHRLHKEKGLEAISMHRGRGRSTAVTESVSYGEYAEVEVVTLIVEAERADDLFEFIFFEADINKPHGGFLYQVPLGHSTRFHLPDLPEEH